MAEDKLNNFFDTFVNTMSTLQQQNPGIMANRLTSGGRSLKMLNGTGKPSAFAWAGLTLQDEAPKLLTILDSN